MWNGKQNESQARIKIAGRNINILRSINDTTLMAESEEELKSLLMKVKGLVRTAYYLGKTLLAFALLKETLLWTKLVEVMEFQLSYSNPKRWCY